MPIRDLAIGFDADDTLWHNENIFEHVHVRYRTLLSRFHDADTVDRTLFATEMRNLERYGYGVKGIHTLRDRDRHRTLGRTDQCRRDPPDSPPGSGHAGSPCGTA
jgi:hypothetical protein